MATGSWHWFFLIQGRGLPEHMIGGDPEFFLRHMFGTLLHDEDAIEPAAWTEYLRCFLHPETIRATCDEYRAGASIDLVHDHADLSQKVRVPMLVLWGPAAGRGAAMTSSGCGATMASVVCDGLTMPFGRRIGVRLRRSAPSEAIVAIPRLH